MLARRASSFALLAAIASLVVACGASPGDAEGTSREALTTGGGGGSGSGGGGGIVVRCAAPTAFSNDDSFQRALAYLGCTPPRAAYAIDSWQSEYVTFCPVSNMVSLQAEVDASSGAPEYATFTASPYTTCSSWKRPPPPGYVEVAYDPNCSGGACGALTPDYGE